MSSTVYAFQIAIFPILIHFKCVYSREKVVQQEEVERREEDKEVFICHRKYIYTSKWAQYAELFFRTVIVLVSIAFGFLTLKQSYFSSQNLEPTGQ